MDATECALLSSTVFPHPWRTFHVVRIVLMMLAIDLASHAGTPPDTAATFAYAPEYVSDTWGKTRNPHFFSGKVIAVDSASLSVEHRWDRYAPPRSLDMETLVVRLDDNTSFHDFPEGRKAVVGDFVHVILSRTDPGLAAEVHNLPGAQVSVRNVADRLVPDEHGMVFADDFESGDLRKWHLRRGQVNVIGRQDEVIAGDHSLRLVRRDYSDTTTPNFNQEVWTHGFPRMKDIWMQWDMKLQGVSTVRAEDGAFALLRPFHYNHAEAFAVILQEKKPDATFRLGIQWGTRPLGKAVITQGRVHRLKVHLRRPSAPEARDGLVETWVDGVLDIQAGGQPETRPGHEFDRLAIGFMHCGRGTARAGVMYLDNLWIGIRDPDAEATPPVSCACPDRVQAADFPHWSRTHGH